MIRIAHLGIEFLLLQILFFWGYSVSCDETAGFYTAAVLEHARFGIIGKDPPNEILDKNLEVYKQAVETAALNNADIIVFPECGLYPHFKTNRSLIMGFVEDIPDPKLASWNPCQEETFKEHKILRTLSCLAQANNIFIVANVGDVKKCEVVEDETCDAENIEECSRSNNICRPDGVKLYNTNVVLDRKGSLVSRYYKHHLYFEPDMDPPDNPEHAYFETDFGLFTTFTCFDICFKESVDSVQERNVRNVAFPTYWFDHFPLMSAIQFHQGWAVTNKVNLLASNIHFPGSGTIGSGIYSASKGALVYTFNPDGRSKLLISEVPKLEEDSNPLSRESVKKIFHMNDGKFVEVDPEDSNSIQNHCSRKALGEPRNIYEDYRCFQVNTTSIVVSKQLEGASGHLESCSNGLCCSLEYEADSMVEGYYLVSSSHISSFYETYGFCIESCYLIRCNSENTEGCSIYPMRANTVFERVKLRGNFTTKYIYPSVIENGMRLTSAKKWKSNDGEINYERQSGDEGKLLSIGLQGRCYDRDPVFPS